MVVVLSSLSSPPRSASPVPRSRLAGVAVIRAGWSLFRFGISGALVSTKAAVSKHAAVVGAQRRAMHALATYLRLSFPLNFRCFLLRDDTQVIFII
jgi:hypothetical protein